MALVLLGSSALHYVRVGLVDLTGRYVLGGSSMLDRFGLIHRMRAKGQSDLDYESIAQAFGFAWRQSELMIGRIPFISSVEHLLLYMFSAGGLILLFKRMQLFPIALHSPSFFGHGTSAALGSSD